MSSRIGPPHVTNEQTSPRTRAHVPRPITPKPPVRQFAKATSPYHTIDVHVWQVGTGSEFKQFVLTRCDRIRDEARSIVVLGCDPPLDVAPEEMAMDEEGSVQLTLG